MRPELFLVLEVDLDVSDVVYVYCVFGLDLAVGGLVGSEVVFAVHVELGVLGGAVRTEEAAFETLAELGVEFLGVLVVADGKVERGGWVVDEE